MSVHVNYEDIEDGLEEILNSFVDECLDPAFSHIEPEKEIKEYKEKIMNLIKFNVFRDD